VRLCRQDFLFLARETSLLESWGLGCVANIYVEASCIVVDVSDHDLRVFVVVAIDVLNIKFTLEHCSYIKLLKKW